MNPLAVPNPDRSATFQIVPCWNALWEKPVYCSATQQLRCAQEAPPRVAMGGRMNSRTLFTIFALCLVSAGQQVTATRNVNLRQDPSRQNPAIRLVPVGEVLELVDSDKVDGYYNVR